MLAVALTGNIGAGKSSVARVWKRVGARIIDADQLARQAVAPGSDALRSISENWGDAVITDGELDRAALREIVFGDPAARVRLEAIVHPAVGELREAAFRLARTQGLALVVADIPLLFEAGMQEEFDVVVLVDAPEALRLQRLVQSRGLAEPLARRMIAAQMPSAPKRELADIIIDNDGSEAQLEAAAAKTWRQLEQRAAGVGPS
jgi:dephospho-CoA kinase